MGVLAFMKYNLKISGFIGLTPMYNIQTDTFTYHPVYSYMAAIFVTAVSSYNTYVLVTFKVWNVTDVAFTLLDFTTVFYILKSSHLKDVSKLVAVLEQFDSKFKTTRVKVDKLTILYIVLFVAMNALSLYRAVVEFSGFVTLYLFLFTNCYCNGVVVLCGLMRAILERLRVINLSWDIRRGSKQEVLKFLELHDLGCTILSTFNDGYGWHIFLYMLCALMFSLRNVRVAVTSTNFEYEVENLSYVMVLLISTVILVVYGEKIKLEMEKSAAKARNMSLLVVKEKMVEATLLVQQTASCGGCISAAGFFSLDHSAIFMFANLIVSNVIVIIQLNPGNLAGQSCYPCNCSG